MDEYNKTCAVCGLKIKHIANTISPIFEHSCIHTIEEYQTALMDLQDENDSIVEELAGEDIKLNKGLMDEQKIMESRIKRYEQVYSQIGREKRLINRDSSMEEDATLNMLSSNKMYIIWSILALGLTFGAVDLLVSDDRKNYILEVNSGPGLIEQGINDYSNAIIEYLENCP